MVAYLPRKDIDATPGETKSSITKPALHHALSRDMLHGLSPEEFDTEAKSLAAASALTPEVRARLQAQLIERLKTPIDAPSWGPDWVRHGEKFAPRVEKNSGRSALASLFGRKDADEDDENVAKDAPILNEREQDDARSIARNMEKSRQVFHYRSLYVLAAAAAIGIALLAMFVDYQIIRGDIWTRALANEFMVVPASLQSTLLFKSLQVVFAVLIVHFMLKITGIYGRNTMVVAAFVFALVMIGGLGYLVAYNNMNGGTSATLEHSQDTTPGSNAIDRLFASTDNRTGDGANVQAPGSEPGVMTASLAGSKGDGFGLSIPRPSAQSLANADSWFWLAFASVIFFIVTTVAALYMQTFENNIRNFLISRDYLHRRKQFAQLHLLELADRPGK